jgi:type III pantothenate kinase
MLLALDIGNSDITIGYWDETSWKYCWRIPSSKVRPELFYGVNLRNYFFESDLKLDSIDRVVVSSVVPELTNRIVAVCKSLFAATPVILGPDLYKKLPIGVLNPYEIGADLVSNALAAYMHFKRSCIVIDFGTALTFTTLSDAGVIEGVAIAPGLKTAIKSLTQNTAKLFDVPLQLPDSVLGKNTVHAIQAGILYGYEGIVINMIRKIREELNDDTIPVIATGGLSSIITSLSAYVTETNPNLTLDGLRISASY